MISAVAVLLFFVLHLIVCVVLWVLVASELLPVRGDLFPFMLLVPVWGPLTAVLLCVQRALRGDSLKASTLEALAIEDERHRGMSAPTDDDREVVPLEEALIVNDAPERRRLILSVLTDDPEGYLSLLQTASLNDDSEVAHYAATAVAQISKEADLKLQRLEQAFKADPSSPERLDEYCDFLGSYIESGLVEGRAEEIQRRQHLALLKRRLEREGGLDLSLACTSAMLDLNMFDEAGVLIAQMVERDGDDQRVWMLALRAASLARDGEGVRSVLAGIDRHRVYLNAQNREKVEFWKSGKGA